MLNFYNLSLQHLIRICHEEEKGLNIQSNVGADDVALFERIPEESQVSLNTSRK